MVCLNICEMAENIYKKRFELKEIQRQAGTQKFERLYFGSNFCGQYFLSLSEVKLNQIIEWAKSENWALTLVLPLFTEKHLNEAKKKINELAPYFGKIIDEVTVNDYGMLAYLSEHYEVKLNIGRVLMKDYRDPRYEAYFKQTLRPKLWTGYFEELMDEYKINGVELDLTHETIDLSQLKQSLTVGVHYPYCYMTVGQICEVASIYKPIDEKFRPNTPCHKECLDFKISYDLQDERQWVRLGKTIYFKNTEGKVEGVKDYRKIYFPLDFEVKQ